MLFPGVAVRMLFQSCLLLRLSHEGSLRCDAWALKQLAQYQGGKLLIWSWVSRGFTNLQQIADWRTDGNLEVAKDLMSRTEAGMQALYSLDDVCEDGPADDDDDDHEKAPIQDELLDGEQVTYWAISQPGEENPQPIPLPDWFRVPIDHLILTWRREHHTWQKRIAKRQEQGKDSLTPKMHTAYQEWLKTPERTLILDKKRHSVVKNPGSKSKPWLKRNCLMLVVHPSVESKDLWITAGNNKKWDLRLMRGVPVSDDNLPAEVDHFSGWVLTR